MTPEVKRVYDNVYVVLVKPNDPKGSSCDDLRDECECDCKGEDVPSEPHKTCQFGACRLEATQSCTRPGKPVETVWYCEDHMEDHRDFCPKGSVESGPSQVTTVVIPDDRIYDEDDFQDDRDRLNTMCDNLLFKKGADYASKTDRLANFRGSKAGNARQVWAILFEKHFNAIMSWASSGKLESEPVESRFADLRNYIDLGYALFCEEERANVMKEPIE